MVREHAIWLGANIDRKRYGGGCWVGQYVAQETQPFSFFFFLSFFRGAGLFSGKARYTKRNLSPVARKYCEDFFHLLNFMFENFIFSYLGVSVFAFEV